MPGECGFASSPGIGFYIVLDGVCRERKDDFHSIFTTTHSFEKAYTYGITSRTIFYGFTDLAACGEIYPDRKSVCVYPSIPSQSVYFFNSLHIS